MLEGKAKDTTNPPLVASVSSSSAVEDISNLPSATTMPETNHATTGLVSAPGFAVSSPVAIELGHNDSASLQPVPETFVPTLESGINPAAKDLTCISAAASNERVEFGSSQMRPAESESAPSLQLATVLDHQPSANSSTCLTADVEMRLAFSPVLQTTSECERSEPSGVDQPKVDAPPVVKAPPTPATSEYERSEPSGVEKPKVAASESAPSLQLATVLDHQPSANSSTCLTADVEMRLASSPVLQTTS